MSTDRLQKLLMLATSDNDNEAILALRQANKLMRESNLNWIDLLKKKPDNSIWKQEYDRVVDQYNVLVRRYNKLVKTGWR